MKTIKLTIQYDGTNYSGWQIQPDRTTIQGLLEGALKRITGHDIKTIAAGRTDAGVHALEQVASFRTDSTLSPEIFKKALNALLPGDIRIVSSTYTVADFHPRYDAKSKSYVYIINNSKIKNPFFLRYTYHLSRTLNTDRMYEASRYLIGCHDFKSFQASGCAAGSTIRTVYKIDIIDTDSIGFLEFHFHGRFIVFRFEADAFLRYMVRNMVGTLIEVGLERLSPAQIKEIIEANDRRKAGPTAPPQGLFLEKIYY